MRSSAAHARYSTHIYTPNGLNIDIYMRRPVPGAGAGPACLRGVAGLAGKCHLLALSVHARAHD